VRGTIVRVKVSLGALVAIAVRINRGKVGEFAGDLPM
jgi:hypothetical protein